MNPVHILLWNYYDKSGFGVVAAFNDEEDAKRLLADLQEHGGESRYYQIITTEIR